MTAASELPQLLRLLFAMTFVLALMGGLALAMRHINTKRFTAGRKRRLQIVESLPLDGRRKAVILRRDDTEHLVILGTNGETVIERGIVSGQDEAHEDPSTVNKPQI